MCVTLCWIRFGFNALALTVSPNVTELAPTGPALGNNPLYYGCSAHVIRLQRNIQQHLKALPIINPQMTVISDPFWYNLDENVLLMNCAICLSIVFLSIRVFSFSAQCVCVKIISICV